MRKKPNPQDSNPPRITPARAPLTQNPGISQNPQSNISPANARGNKPSAANPSTRGTISIIIPSAPQRSFNDITENLRRIRPADLTLQIILVKGTFPPLQRNLAIEKANGDYIFLFDDDVIVPPGVIEKVLEDFAKYPDVDVIGGPNLTPPDNGFLQHCFGLAHSSYFTGASTATRYFPARNLKNISESNLISCNLAFRTNTLKKNPFDPVVFPNEENELIGRLQRLNYKLSYNPEFFVYHHRRKTLSGYIKQIFNWGAGRTVHSLTRPAHFNPVFLVPLAFLLYLISLAFYRPFWYITPLILYVVLDVGFSFSAAISIRQTPNPERKPAGAKSGAPCFFPVMLLLFPLTHIIYALGLVWGLVRHFGRHRIVPAKESFQTIEIVIN